MRAVSMVVGVSAVALAIGCSSPTEPTGPAAASPAPPGGAPAAVPAAAVPVPTPEAAIAVVEQFYAGYRGALTPALTALLTPEQQTRAAAHTARCRAAGTGEVPAACEADQFTCAQDDVQLTTPTFSLPGTVTVKWQGAPEVGVDVALKDVQGAWKIDGFTCRVE